MNVCTAKNVCVRGEYKQSADSKTNLTGVRLNLKTSQNFD